MGLGAVMSVNGGLTVDDHTVDDHGELPVGWKTRVDPSSGRQMFYNRSTGETSWRRPPGSVARTSNPVARLPDNFGVRTSGARSFVRPGSSSTRPSMEIESAESHAAASDGDPGRDEDVFLDPEHSGPVAKCLCALFFVVGMMIAGIYLMLLFVVIEFDESGSAQVFFLIASFFGVLASCSLVMCLML